jgi:hypothetical protein
VSLSWGIRYSALIIKAHDASAKILTMYFLYTKKLKKVHGKHILYIYRCGIIGQENVPGTSFILSLMRGCEEENDDEH